MFVYLCDFHKFFLFCFVFEISLFFLLFVNKLWLLDYVNKFHFGSIWNPHHRHQSKRKRWWKWKWNEKEKEKGLYPDIEIIYSFEENEKNLLIIVCVRQLTILCLINNHANIVVCLFVWFPWLIWRMFPNPKKKKKSLSSSSSSSLRLADNCLMMMIEWTIRILYMIGVEIHMAMLISTHPIYFSSSSLSSSDPSNENYFYCRIRKAWKQKFMKTATPSSVRIKGFFCYYFFLNLFIRITIEKSGLN